MEGDKINRKARPPLVSQSIDISRNIGSISPPRTSAVLTTPAIEVPAVPFCRRERAIRELAGGRTRGSLLFKKRNSKQKARWWSIGDRGRCPVPGILTASPCIDILDGLSTSASTEDANARTLLECLSSSLAGGVTPHSSRLQCRSTCSARRQQVLCRCRRWSHEYRDSSEP